MQEFMRELLFCSITMSMVSILYMLISSLLSNRYSAKWQCYAWFIIIISFIIPFRPHFDLKLFTLPLPVSFVQDVITVGTVNFSNSLEILQNNDYVTEGSKISLYEITFLLWIIGAIVTLVYSLFRHYVSIRMINHWKENITDELTLNILKKQKEALGIKNDIAIQRCPLITASMLVGLTKPVILLQSTQYSEEELSFIIKHELVHFKNRDLHFKALLLAAKAIHWFNPTIYLINRAVSIQCEKACDDAVIGSANFEIRKKYALLVSNTAINQLSIQTALATNFYGDKYTIKSRILSILDTKERKAGITILCCLLAIVFCTGMIFPKNDNVLKAVDNQSSLKTDFEKVDTYIDEIEVTAAEQRKDVENDEKVTNFESISTSFSVTNMYNNLMENRWDVSFQWINGSVSSKINYKNGSPGSLKILSQVESGSLILQLEQADKVMEVPLGDQTVSLDSFNDGEIVIKIICNDAENGWVITEILLDDLQNTP